MIGKGWLGRDSLLQGTVALLVIGSAAAMAPATAAQSAFSEYQVKAAFIKNFIKYVAWPSGTPASLTLCIFGTDPFQDALPGQTDLGEGRSLVVRRIGKLQESTDCQILFVPQEERTAIPELVAALAARPVLTVGDGDGMAQAGVMLGFVSEDQKVRFEANLAPVRRAGLTLSSRLLGLAKTIHNAR